MSSSMMDLDGSPSKRKRAQAAQAAVFSSDLQVGDEARQMTEDDDKGPRNFWFRFESEFLRNLVDAVSSVMKEGHFHFINNATFSGIKVSGLNQANTLMIKAELPGKAIAFQPPKKQGTSHHTCCLNLSLLKAALVNLNLSKPVWVEQKAGAVEVRVYGYTNYDHLQDVKLMPLSIDWEAEGSVTVHFNYEFDLQKSFLQEMLNLAADSYQAKMLQIRLFEARAEEEYYVYFTIKAEDNQTTMNRHIHIKPTDEDDGGHQDGVDPVAIPKQLDVEELVRTKNLRQKIDKKFGVELLQQALKKLHCHRLSISVANDSLPSDMDQDVLRLHVELGGVNTFADIIVAAKVNDPDGLGE